MSTNKAFSSQPQPSTATTTHNPYQPPPTTTTFRNNRSTTTHHHRACQQQQQHDVATSPAGRSATAHGDDLECQQTCHVIQMVTMPVVVTVPMISGEQQPSLIFSLEKQGPHRHPLCHLHHQQPPPLHTPTRPEPPLDMPTTTTTRPCHVISQTDEGRQLTATTWHISGCATLFRW